jgi:hypothetical protein
MMRRVPRPRRTTPTGSRSRTRRRPEASREGRWPPWPSGRTGAGPGDADERDVHEERGPPAPLRAEQCDEDPAQHGADRDGHPDDAAEQPERATAGRTAEVLLDEARDLGVDEPGAQSHDDAGQVEGQGIASQSRDQRPEPEQHESRDEDPAPAIDVPGAAGRHEHDSERQRIAGQDPLQRRRGGLEGGLDGGEDDIDDRHAQQRQERDDQRHCQDAALFRGEGVRVRC